MESISERYQKEEERYLNIREIGNILMKSQLKLRDQTERGTKRRRYIKDIIPVSRKKGNKYQGNGKDAYIHNITEVENNTEEEDVCVNTREYDGSDNEREHVPSKINDRMINTSTGTSSMYNIILVRLEGHNKHYQWSKKRKVEGNNTIYHCIPVSLTVSFLFPSPQNTVKNINRVVC